MFTTLVKGFGLTDTRFNLVYSRDRDTDHDGSSMTAAIHPNRQYGSAVMEVVVPNFEGMDDDEIAEALIHEIIHYLIHPISRYGESKDYDYLEELVCTDVAKAIGQVIEATGREVSDHWRKTVKVMEKDLKKQQKEKRA